MWLPQLRTLDDEYRLVVPDLPGHGRRANESFTFESAISGLDDSEKQTGLHSLSAYMVVLMPGQKPLLTRVILMNSIA
jgi:pimeloyl-ACP methyl ester carboxylesterase